MKKLHKSALFSAVVLVITLLGAGSYTTQLPGDDQLRTGALKWRFATEAWVYSSPAIGSDGTIYIGSSDNHLYALNLDGTEKWRFHTKERVDCSPVIGPDGTIYVAAGDRFLSDYAPLRGYFLYAVNPDGTERWHIETNDKIPCLPAIGADGTIYYGLVEIKEDEKYSYLVALHPDGREKRRFEAGKANSLSPPAIGADGTVYFATLDSRYVYALNPDGTERWRFKMENFGSSGLSIGADGTVYVGSRNGNLYALNPDGTERWRFKAGGTIHSAPAVAADGTIYFGTAGARLYALNPDGTEKWRFKTLLVIYSTPALGADGMIYFGSRDGELHALDPDGTEQWHYKAWGVLYSSPVIGPDGTVYVGCSDFYLYAIYSNSQGLADAPWPMFQHDPKHTGRIGP